MTEMVCFSSAGRITPGCAGLYADEHTTAWRRIVDLVHSATSAKIGAQLGHSGRKGSNRLMWEGIDEPLPNSSRQAVAPSASSYGPANRVPVEVDRAGILSILAAFVAAAHLAADRRSRRV